MSAKHVKRGVPKRRASKARPSRVVPRQVANRLPIDQGKADKVARGALGAFFGVIAIGTLVALDVPAKAGHMAGEAIGNMGFRVRSIDVVGIEKMDHQTVYAHALDQRTTALPLVNTAAVRERLLDYGWVRDARVSRRYPDTLVIDIVERTPAALWQAGDKLNLVDDEGVVLDRVPISEMPDLPLLLGPGANRQLPQLTRILEREPALRAQLASARWVGGRRWDLNVTTGEILALPEGERAASEALAKFMRADRKSPLLGIGAERYDLRIPGQAIARVPGAAERISEQQQEGQQ